jgi:Ca2+-binding RTX toxin-like protein
MATLTWNKSYGFNLYSLDLSNLLYGSSYTRSSDLFVAKYSYDGAFRDELRGSGFTYDAGGILTGGVVTSYATFNAGKRVALLDGASIGVTSLANAASTLDTKDDYLIFKTALSGNDRITGGRYNDKIEAFAGNDIVVGNGGADRLYGGAGADTFVFRSKTDSTVSKSGRDTIYSFSGKSGDKIDLKAIDAKTNIAGNQTFSFIGKQGFHEKAGELRYEKFSGGSVVSGDVNGDGQADFSIYLKGVSSLSKGYFLL